MILARPDGSHLVTKPFADNEQQPEWQQQLIRMACKHKVEEVLDLHCDPSADPDAQALFDNQQRFVSSAFIKVSFKGKAADILHECSDLH